jgi:hypothetical protein
MKIIRGTVFGGITFFLLGWLVYGILLMDFVSTNSNQCAARPNMEMIWWALILSNLLLALLLTLILNWSGAKGIMDGLKTGAIFGLILGLSMDLSLYSMTITYNGLTLLVVDVLVYTVMMAITGLVIVLLWGKEKTT